MAQNVCHRCSTPLPEGTLFCMECGAPQLVLTETDTQRVADERAAQASGGTPLPRATAMGRIRWRLALRIMAIFAISAGVAAALSYTLPFFGFIRTMTILLGSTLTINFYRKQAPDAPMSAGIGARIGMVLGFLFSFTVMAANVVFVLVYRYTMHNGAQMDQKINAAMQQSMTQQIAAYPSLYPDPQLMEPVLHLMQSPDGHAMMALFLGAFIVTCTVAYCTFAGAVWGWRMGLRSKA